MPEFIGGQPGSGVAGVDTQDLYTPACTLGPAQDVVQITFNVVGNPAFVQFWKPVPGQPSKATLEPVERFYYANTYGVIASGVSGARFRSYNTGQPATITAEMDFLTDPTLFPGTVAGVTLTPSGGIVPPSQLETTDGVVDVVPTNELLIGAGITLTDLGGGIAQLEAAGGLEISDGVTDVNPASELLIGAGIVLTEPTPGVAQIDATATPALRHLDVLWQAAKLPSAPGVIGPWLIPQIGGLNVNYQLSLAALFFNTAAAGTNTAKAQLSSDGGGTWTDITGTALSVTAGNHLAGGSPTAVISSGNLVRLVFTAIADLTNVWTYQLEGDETP